VERVPRGKKKGLIGGGKDRKKKKLVKKSWWSVKKKFSVTREGGSVTGTPFGFWQKKERTINCLPGDPDWGKNRGTVSAKVFAYHPTKKKILKGKRFSVEGGKDGAPPRPKIVSKGKTGARQRTGLGGEGSAMGGGTP